MKSIKIYFEGGNSLVTSINGTDEEIRAYYIGQTFNTGSGADDCMEKCVSIEFLK